MWLGKHSECTWTAWGITLKVESWLSSSVDISYYYICRPTVKFADHAHVWREVQFHPVPEVPTVTLRGIVSTYSSVKYDPDLLVGKVCLSFISIVHRLVEVEVVVALNQTTLSASKNLETWVHIYHIENFCLSVVFLLAVAEFQSSQAPSRNLEVGGQTA